ncbi:hypothetical protein J1605_006975 [Eschrichtius robustus]|uniref:Uncharacterized protein n=1 Tax=Eschrichtius robustus TaxID=9764 RepID=A0AB34H2R1_ESCRO|nr:hypothetical protein J1605_006975 [Eschrichtius robustus]
MSRTPLRVLCACARDRLRASPPDQLRPSDPGSTEEETEAQEGKMDKFTQLCMEESEVEPRVTGLTPGRSTKTLSATQLLVLESLLQRRGVAVAYQGDKDTGSRSSGKYFLA